MSHELERSKIVQPSLADFTGRLHMAFSRAVDRRLHTLTFQNHLLSDGVSLRNQFSRVPLVMGHKHTSISHKERFTRFL